MTLRKKTRMRLVLTQIRRDYRFVTKFPPLYVPVDSRGGGNMN